MMIKEINFESDVEDHVNSWDLSELSDQFDEEEEEEDLYCEEEEERDSERDREGDLFVGLSIDDISFSRDLNLVNMPQKREVRKRSERQRVVQSNGGGGGGPSTNSNTNSNMNMSLGNASLSSASVLTTADINNEGGSAATAAGGAGERNSQSQRAYREVNSILRQNNREDRGKSHHNTLPSDRPGKNDKSERPERRERGRNRDTQRQQNYPVETQVESTKPNRSNVNGDKFQKPRADRQRPFQGGRNERFDQLNAQQKGPYDNRKRVGQQRFDKSGQHQYFQEAQDASYYEYGYEYNQDYPQEYYQQEYNYADSQPEVSSAPYGNNYGRYANAPNANAPPLPPPPTSPAIGVGYLNPNAREFVPNFSIR